MRVFQLPPVSVSQPWQIGIVPSLILTINQTCLSERSGYGAICPQKQGI